MTHKYMSICVDIVKVFVTWSEMTTVPLCHCSYHIEPHGETAQVILMCNQCQ